MESMKETEYYKSGKHLENVLRASEKGRDASRLKKLQREAEYNANPKLCLCCGLPIEYKKKNTSKFCSKSCAATYNNTGRVHTTNTKRKIAESVSETLKDAVYSKKRHGMAPLKSWAWLGRYCVLHEITCAVCGCKKLVRARQKYRKTCSPECKMTASIANRTYQNGKKKLIKYYNKWIDKEVNLESSWELTIAEMLDKKDIEWYRPKAMKWIDATGKNRLYYCDFYLPKYDTYLDPKNPYCMELDADKLKWFESRINLIAGDIALIQMVVENLNEVDDNNQTS